MTLRGIYLVLHEPVLGHKFEVFVIIPHGQILSNLIQSLRLAKKEMLSEQTNQDLPRWIKNRIHEKKSKKKKRADSLDNSYKYALTFKIVSLIQQI